MIRAGEHLDEVLDRLDSMSGGSVSLEVCRGGIVRGRPAGSELARGTAG